MPFEVENGQAKLWTSYSLKVPANPDGFNSHESSVGIEMTFPIGKATPAELLSELEAIEQQVFNHLKFSVGAELGVEMVTGRDGITLPVVQVKPKVAGTPVAPAPAPAGGGGGQPRGADTGDLPTFQAALDQTGVHTWIDLRPLKVSGKFKPNAADFRDADNNKHQVWLKDKQGQVKQDVAAALTAAGVSALPFDAEPTF
jgi:hypothetical protein